MYVTGIVRNSHIISAKINVMYSFAILDVTFTIANTEVFFFGLTYTHHYL